MKEIIILGPNLHLSGGVAHYYRTLKLNTHKNISYFNVNSLKPQKSIVALMRVLINYCKFCYQVIDKHCEVVVLNPSLDNGRSFYRELGFILICRVLNRKTIVFFRGWLNSSEELIKASKLKTFLFSISYATVNQYIVLGKVFKTKLIKLGVPSTTPFHIETTVADSGSLDNFNLKDKHLSFTKEIKVLFLSRIEKDKGIYIAINAYRMFLARHPDIKSSFIIAGDGPDLMAVKKYVWLEKIPYITFLGHITANNKNKILQECHILLFPSYTEGMPNCILESMLLGMPIISRITGAIPEIILPYINGFLSESFDASVFTEFLTILAIDRELYINISNNNHFEAVQRFTREKVKERMLKIYASI